MGKGRKATPSAVYREARGLVPLEPLEKPPPAPAWLTESAKRAWDDLAGKLCTRYVLTCMDMQSLAALSAACGLMEDAQEHLKKHGLVVKGAKGGDVRNPAIMILRDCASTIARFAIMFGLTPAGRDRGGIFAATAGLSELDRFNAEVDEPDDDPEDVVPHNGAVSPTG